MCPNCRAFITTSDRVCPYCDASVGPRAIDRRSPGDLLGGLIPHARFITFTIMLVNFGLYIAMMINIRFDYWEVRPNELLHHHGVLSNLERYSAPNMRISKEIDDVFEYMLLRSGRLIIHPSNEPRAFVLETVLGIDKKELAITKMLGALQVQVRDDKSE